MSVTSCLWTRRCCNHCGFQLDRAPSMMHCCSIRLARLALKLWARKGLAKMVHEQQKQAHGSFENRPTRAAKIAPQGSCNHPW